MHLRFFVGVGDGLTASQPWSRGIVCINGELHHLYHGCKLCFSSELAIISQPKQPYFFSQLSLINPTRRS